MRTEVVQDRDQRGNWWGQLEIYSSIRRIL